MSKTENTLKIQFALLTVYDLLHESFLSVVLNNWA